MTFDELAERAGVEVAAGGETAEGFLGAALTGAP